MTITPAPKTRGFLFSDLRGYSAFTDAHGDDAARALGLTPAALEGAWRRLVRAPPAAR